MARAWQGALHALAALAMLLAWPCLCHGKDVPATCSTAASSCATTALLSPPLPAPPHVMTRPCHVIAANTPPRLLTQTTVLLLATTVGQLGALQRGSRPQLLALWANEAADDGDAAAHREAQAHTWADGCLVGGEAGTQRGERWDLRLRMSLQQPTVRPWPTPGPLDARPAPRGRHPLRRAQGFAAEAVDAAARCEALAHTRASACTAGGEAGTQCGERRDLQLRPSMQRPTVRPWPTPGLLAARPAPRSGHPPQRAPGSAAEAVDAAARMGGNPSRDPRRDPRKDYRCGGGERQRHGKNMASDMVRTWPGRVPQVLAHGKGERLRRSPLPCPCHVLAVSLQCL
jgi:hypothetical protein